MFFSLKHQKLNPHNIIVRMPNWLGDLIMATPILTDLRNHFPHAKITALCQGAVGSIIEKDPNIDDLISFKRKKKWSLFRSEQDIIPYLKKGQYDLGILLTNSFSSAKMFWDAGIPYRFGFATHWRRLLLTHPIKFPENKDTQHLVKTYKALLYPLGIPISNTDPRLYLTETEIIKSQTQLSEFGIDQDKILIGINPGAAYGSAKCWLPERYHEIAQLLLNNPRVSLIFFGDNQGASLVNMICQSLPKDRVINLAGQTTLRELAAYIKKCDLFLTNDSGPMHMASALDVPLLALFGSTSDQTTSPYKGGKVIHKHVACSPCYRRECPIDFRCMKQITVHEVYENLTALISQTK